MLREQQLRDETKGGTCSLRNARLSFPCLRNRTHDGWHSVPDGTPWSAAIRLVAPCGQRTTAIWA